MNTIQKIAKYTTLFTLFVLFQIEYILLMDMQKLELNSKAFWIILGVVIGLGVFGYFVFTTYEGMVNNDNNTRKNEIFK